MFSVIVAFLLTLSTIDWNFITVSIRFGMSVLSFVILCALSLGIVDFMELFILVLTVACHERTVKVNEHFLWKYNIIDSTDAVNKVLKTIVPKIKLHHIQLSVTCPKKFARAGHWVI